MEIKNVFYGIGIFFLFLSIGYFVSSYLDEVDNLAKSILIFLLSVLLFFTGDYLRRKNI